MLKNKYCSLVQIHATLFVSIPADFVKQARLKKGDYVQAVWATETPTIIAFKAVKGNQREALERIIEELDREEREESRKWSVAPTEEDQENEQQTA